MGSRLVKPLVLAWPALVLAACSPEPQTGCKKDSDCAAEQCRRATCSDGICVQAVDDTATVPQESPTDCKRQVCRNGRAVAEADDTEVPDDDVPCTVDSCSKGAPVHAPRHASCPAAPACKRARCSPGAGADADGCIVEADSLAVEDDHFSCTLDLCRNGEPVHEARDSACTDLATGVTCVKAVCDPAAELADQATGCAPLRQDAACADTNPCTADGCNPTHEGADPTTGCWHAALDGEVAQVPGNCRHEACSSGLPADQTDLSDLPAGTDGADCTSPSCEGGVPHEKPDDSKCDDHLACTRDRCSASGCGAVPDDAACPSARHCSPAADPGTVPSGCLDSDACPPVMVLTPGADAVGDTTDARDDFHPSCADASSDQPDLAYRLVLSAPASLQVSLRAAGRRLAVALVTIENSACARELQCATGAGSAGFDVLNLPAGTYALVVDGDGATRSAGPFALSVETAAAGALQAGDLVISELLANPDAVSDSLGEYLEISNPGLAGIALDGLLLSKDAGATTSALAGPAGRLVYAPPGGQVVGVASTDFALNGGIRADFKLPFSLGNSATEKLQLSVAGGPVLDAVDQRAGSFPTSAPQGISWQLDPPKLNATQNDAWASWCSTAAGRVFGEGDRGTPGAPNVLCHPECDSSTDCDDSNPCTVDRCRPNLSCANIADDTLVPGDDGLSCTGTAFCQGGQRVDPPDHSACDDAAPCTTDTCVGATGEAGTGCAHVADSTVCDAAPACRRAVCDPGPGADLKGCVQEPDDGATEADSFACTQDACSDGAPLHVPVDAVCDGGTDHAGPACILSVCSPATTGADAVTGCVTQRVDLACADANPCTADLCEPDHADADTDTGCRHTLIDGERPQVAGNCRRELCDQGAAADVPDATDLPSEADGVACTVPSCEGGAAHEQTDSSRCADAYACTRDVCESAGCVHVPEHSLCQSATWCAPADAGTDATGCVDADVCPPVLTMPLTGSASSDTTAAGDDFQLSCADHSAAHPDLAHAFTLGETSSVQFALVAPGRKVALGLVQVAGGACATELLCARGTGLAELGVRNLPAGTYALVADGDGTDLSAGPFNLTATTSPPLLQAGDLVFNEVMSNPDAVSDSVGEYVEIANPGTAAVVLNSLLLSEDAGGSVPYPFAHPDGRLIVARAGGHVVGVVNVAAAVNGGIAADFRLPFAMGNTPNERLRIKTAEGLLLDLLDLTATGFSAAATAGVSIQLDPLSRSATENDVFASHWCPTPAGVTFPDGATDGDRGTPGMPNVWCPWHTPCSGATDCGDSNPCTTDACLPDGTCSHVADDDAVPPDDGFSCTTSACAGGLRVDTPHHDACTDSVACTVDTCAGAGGEAGTGCAHAPDASLCAENQSCDRALGCVARKPAGDTCELALELAAAPVATTTAGMGNDLDTPCGPAQGRELFLRVTLAQTGSLTFSAPGPAGRALALYEGTCGSLRPLACRTLAGQGESLEVRGLDAGTYLLVVDDATDAATDAFDAQAAVVSGDLAPGDLVISEFLPDPAAPLEESTAEWVELTNPRGFFVSTGALKLSSGGAGSPVRGGSTAALQLVVPPGGFLLGARSANPALNGGLAPDFVFTEGLTNTASSDPIDTLRLWIARATAVDVDVVAYNRPTHATNPFPRVDPGKAMSLSPAKLDAAQNDAGASWCGIASGAAYSAGNYGTPRAANPACPAP